MASPTSAHPPRSRLFGPRPRRAVALAAATLLLATVTAAAVPSSRAIGPATARAETIAAPVPTASRFTAARRFAEGRRGTVAIAVVDTAGRLRSFRGERTFASASVVKAMLLVAYLDHLDRRSQRLSRTAARRLGAMIRRSSNRAATWAYRIVGPAGLRRVAWRARMRRFAPAPAWGNSLIAARDQARFFLRVVRLVPSQHRAFARELLAGIVASQRWGIPAAAPPHYVVLFKGGWRCAPGEPAEPRSRCRRGWLVHQVARLEDGRRALSIAILSSGSPTEAYGVETVRGVAERLLR